MGQGDDFTLSFAAKDQPTRDDEILRLMHQLRPYLSTDEFAARFEAATAEGYKCFAVLKAERIVGYIGYRISNTLAIGRCLYINDLVVDDALRSKGIGRQIISFARALAAKESCTQIKLDCSFSRIMAQSFYEDQGFEKTGFVFSFASKGK